ncbi:MAG: carbohydrate ABC transporter permease [Caldisericaceae bacterium]
MEERLQQNLIQSKKRRKIKEYLTGYGFIAPALLILLIFAIFPTLYVFYLSTFNWSMLGQKTFLGLQNYVNLIFKMPYAKDFWHAVLVTLEYVAISVPVSLSLSLFLATLLMKPIKLRGFFRLGIFISYVTPLVATSIVWMWIYNNNDYGLLNSILKLLHLPTSQWLLGFPSALFAIVIYTVWHDVGYSTILFMAGLTSVSKELQEAAEIDGANQSQVFWKITWPLLSPTTFYIFIISLIGAFKMFTPVLVLTNGGPYGMTQTIAYLLYHEAFVNWNTGFASAIAVVLFVIIFIITILQFRSTGRKVFYSGESAEGEVS